MVSAKDKGRSVDQVKMVALAEISGHIARSRSLFATVLHDEETGASRENCDSRAFVHFGGGICTYSPSFLGKYAFKAIFRDGDMSFRPYPK